MPDEYKRPMNCCIAELPILSTTDNTRSPRSGSSPELTLSRKVMRQNNDLPNTSSRSTTETFMYPIGQNILVIVSILEIETVQPPQFLNLVDSKDVRHARF